MTTVLVIEVGGQSQVPPSYQQLKNKLEFLLVFPCDDYDNLKIFKQTRFNECETWTLEVSSDRVC